MKFCDLLKYLIMPAVAILCCSILAKDTRNDFLSCYILKTIVERMWGGLLKKLPS